MKRSTINGLHWMRKSVRWMTAAAAALSLVAGAAGSVHAAAPDVLSQVPGDAMGFVVLNNLQGFSKKIQHIESRLQIPSSANPLSTMEMQVGIDGGLDPHGSMAMVFLRAPAGFAQRHPGQPAAVILLPGTDTKTMFAQDNPSVPANGVITFTDPSGTTNYATVHGSYTAVAQSKAVLSEYLAATTWGMPIETSPHTLAALHTDDIAAYLNSAVAHPLAEKQLESIRTKMDQSGQQAQQIVAGDMAISLAEDLLAQTHAMMLGLNMDDSGIALNGHLDIVAGSPLAQALTSGKPLGPKPFMGLPAGDNLGLFSYNGSTAPIVGLLRTALTEGAAKNPQSNQPDYQLALKNARGRFKHVYAGAMATASVLLAPRGDEPILRLLAVTQSQSAQAIEHQTLEGLKTSLGQIVANPGIADAGLKATYAENPDAFELADGTHVASATVNLEPTRKALSPVMQHVRQMMLKGERMMWLGNHGAEINMAPVGQSLISGLNVSHKKFSQTAADLKAGTDTISSEKDVITAGKHLLPNPSAVAYLPIDRWIIVALDKLRAMNGFPPGGPQPVTATPASISAAASGNSANVRFFLPEDQLESIVTQGKQVFPLIMMMEMNAQQGG
ncbi:MAG: hypothetical protein HKL96_13910 [Phycisphaerales bacterium]|nr:hypothetical protein [Phycisphaerales bacterium]